MVRGWGARTCMLSIYTYQFWKGSWKQLQYYNWVFGGLKIIIRMKWVRSRMQWGDVRLYSPVSGWIRWYFLTGTTEVTRRMQSLCLKCVIANNGNERQYGFTQLSKIYFICIQKTCLSADEIEIYNWFSKCKLMLPKVYNILLSIYTIKAVTL